MGEALGVLAGPRTEHGSQQVRECGLGQVSAQQRGQGDAELGGGQLERQLVQGLRHRTSDPLAGLRVTIDGRPVDRHERKFAHHEERVEQGQQHEREQRQEHGHKRGVDVSPLRALLYPIDDPLTRTPSAAPLVNVVRRCPAAAAAAAAARRPPRRSRNANRAIAGQSFLDREDIGRCA